MGLFDSLWRQATGTQTQERDDARYDADVASARDIEATRVANQHTDRRITEGRAFSERMSSSAYTRAVADMRAAGLNPAVLMSGSGGASATPGSPMAGAIKSDPSSALQASTAGGRGLTDRARLAKESSALGADIAFKIVSAKKMAQDVKTSKAQESKLKRELKLISSQEANIDSQAGLNSAKTVRENAAAVSEVKMSDFERKSNFGWFDAIKKRLNPFSKSLGR